MNEQQEVIKALEQEWELALPDTVSEAAIIEKLALRIAEVIQKGPETFFQLMYRLDVPEKKLNEVMISADNQYQIAKLIYERQVQKIKNRMLNRKKDRPTDPDLEW